MEKLLGLVETFDGETLRGWAGHEVDPRRELAVDIYLDGAHVARVAANEPRAHSAAETHSPGNGFCFRFTPPLSDPAGPPVLPAIPRLRVQWAETDRAIPVARDLKGIVNVDDFGVSESFLMFSDSEFVPVPDASLREHVAGKGFSASHYRSVGMFVALDLMQWGLLWPTTRVVDLGCGCGRVAAHLAPIIGTQGRYWGFDTWKIGTDWATSEITKRYPKATFHHLTEKRAGRDAGYVGDRAYRLPLDAGSCDLVLCASLFTHLTYEAALDYLLELGRVLEPHGRVYLSCFIYDGEAEALLAPMGLSQDQHGAYSQHKGFFDSYFTRSTFDQLFSQAGFSPVVLRHGHWRGAKYSERRPIGYQDLFVLRKS